ncbi:MAG TPA: hypothetical protein VMD56_03335 [Steroidobacteraceae bacterium]|nr:hypothetical protein [Steroidobacteraceae bacterium]
MPFATGLSVGLATSLVGLILAVAWERSRRARRVSLAASTHALDEELAQTFPASDPLPHSHRVD